MNLRFKNLQVVVMLMALCGCVAAQEVAKAAVPAGSAEVAKSSGDGSSTSAAASKVDPNAYVLGAEDVISVSVWKEPDVTKTVSVRPDGMISLPLVGEVKAGGLTPMELQAQLKRGLAKFIDSPEVTVIVDAAKSHKFNVVGEVVKPGSYDLNSTVTVLDALAVAGGLKDFAKSKQIYILRKNADGTDQRLPFNYKDVIKGKHSEQNLALAPHDTVVVP
jgi:polysaccharide export outer membrane protein